MGGTLLRLVCSRVVLYQLIQRKIARRASARVAKTRPWRHSRLSDLPERLGHGVVPAHPGATDRGAELVALAELEVVVRGVLRPAVGVADDAGDRAAAGGDGHAEGVEDELGAHVVGHRVAEQPARAEIEHRRQVQPALAGRDVDTPRRSAVKQQLVRRSSRSVGQAASSSHATSLTRHHQRRPRSLLATLRRAALWRSPAARRWS